MSKKLEEVQKEQKVFSILQANIDNQRSQADTNQLVLNEMRSIRDEVNTVKKEVTMKFDKMTEMVQEVRDSVTLINAECDLVQSAVATKSIILTKDRYTEEEASFPKVVGKYRRMIWSQLKRKYGVPKYNCIRRIDYQGAVDFIGNFRVEDFM